MVEDSVHYSIADHDALEEWASSIPKGFGYIRLGPEYRAFAISMFHQYHCLRVMRDALSGNYNESVVEHYGHCLGYLRQLILCSPDLTLEPHDLLTSGTGKGAIGATHVCEDWTQVYDAMSSNWDAWSTFRTALIERKKNHTSLPSLV